MNIKKYQMSLQQYRAFYSVQCRRTYSDLKHVLHFHVRHFQRPRVELE